MEHLENKLIHITSYRGSPRDRYARVLHVRNMNLFLLHQKSYTKNPWLPRSRYLITIHDIEKNEYRSYYHEYMVFTEVSKPRRWWHRLAQWWRDN